MADNNKKLLEEIQAAVDELKLSATESQLLLWDEMENVIKQLELSNDSQVQNSVTNLKLISDAKALVENAVLNNEYLRSAAAYIKAFNNVEQLHQEYFDVLQTTQEVETKNAVEYKVGITPATSDVREYWIRKALEQGRALEQQGKYLEANQLYGEILSKGQTQLEKIFSDLPEVKIIVHNTKGNFFSTTEPSFSVDVIDSTGSNRNEILGRLSKISQDWLQENVHISENIVTPPEKQILGVEQPDGSVLEPQYNIKFNRALTEPEIVELNQLIQSKGLAGSTLDYNGKGVLLYNISKFKSPDEFIQEIGKVVEAIRGDKNFRGLYDGVEQSIKKLWNIGKSDNGATRSYDEANQLSGKVREQIDFAAKVAVLQQQIKKSAIEATVNSLTEAGIQANVTDRIGDILRGNIVSGISYSDLSTLLRDFIVGNQQVDGVVTRYVNQISVDAINGYSRQYTKTMSDGLGLQWFAYIGSLIKTSREFCEFMVKKHYFKNTEIPDIVLGYIDGHNCKKYAKTGLPLGMKAGTNAANFQVNAGGWVCGHQVIPVLEKSVPEYNRAVGDWDYVTADAAQQLLQKSKAEENFFGSLIGEVANKYPDSSNLGTNFKSLYSTTRKGTTDYADDYGNPDVTQIKDSIRSAFLVPPKDVTAVANEINNDAKAHGYETRLKLQNTSLGFTGYIVNVRMPNGAWSEIQVNTPRMYYAKEPDALEYLTKEQYDQIFADTGLPSGMGHGYYEKWRLPDTPAAEKAELERISQEYYSHFDDGRWKPQ